MRKRFLVLSLLPFALLSCKEETGYYYKDNSFQLARNGDFFLSDFSKFEEYDELGNDDSASSTISYSEMGESFCIIRTSSNCHACNSFKQAFIDFIKDTFLDITVYSSENVSINSYISTLTEHFGEDKLESTDDCKFMSKTPVIYYGNEKAGIKIANYGSVSKKELTKNFFEKGSITNLYKFSSIEALKEGMEHYEPLVYLLNENEESSVSFYKENIYQKAIKSKKATFVVSLSRANRENKVKIKEYFSDFSLMYKDNKKSLSDISSAKALVEDFYG